MLETKWRLRIYIYIRRNLRGDRKSCFPYSSSWISLKTELRRSPFCEAILQILDRRKEGRKEKTGIKIKLFGKVQ